jgi:putative NADH-flavin reductase
MKLAVLGATGGIGLEIIGQAMERGHHVTAFVRSPESLETFGSRIAVMQGDLLNDSELCQAIAGQDAVLSGFGPRVPISKTDHDLLRRFARTLTTAMQRAGVRRLVIVSTAFLFKDSIIPPAYLFGRLFFPAIVADATEMEGIVRQSGLEWTIVRPPRLTDKSRTAKYRVREDHLPSLGFAVSRANVAHFMLDEAEKNAHIRKVVGVCE